MCSVPLGHFDDVVLVGTALFLQRLSHLRTTWNCQKVLHSKDNSGGSFVGRVNKLDVDNRAQYFLVVYFLILKFFFKTNYPFLLRELACYISKVSLRAKSGLHGHTLLRAGDVKSSVKDGTGTHRWDCELLEVILRPSRGDHISQLKTEFTLIGIPPPRYKTVHRNFCDHPQEIQPLLEYARKRLSFLGIHNIP